MTDQLVELIGLAVGNRSRDHRASTALMYLGVTDGEFISSGEKRILLGIPSNFAFLSSLGVTVLTLHTANELHGEGFVEST